MVYNSLYFIKVGIVLALLVALKWCLEILYDNWKIEKGGKS